MNCQYTHLEQEALLHISGPDTLKFLQGQTTCDTRKVTPNHAVPGVFCTPKGRVVCDFLLFELGQDHFALRLRRGIRATSSAVFGKYIIFSKAKLDATREDWSPYACWGQDAATILSNIFGELPSERFGTTRGDGFVLVQTDARGQQFECYLDSSSGAANLARMDELMNPGSETQWQALQIASGIARIEATTVEEFVPQTLKVTTAPAMSASTKGVIRARKWSPASTIWANPNAAPMLRSYRLERIALQAPQCTTPFQARISAL